MSNDGSKFPCATKSTEHPTLKYSKNEGAENANEGYYIVLDVISVIFIGNDGNIILIDDQISFAVLNNLF